MMEIKAAGGTRAPFILDWLIWLSIPKVNAEWENPEDEAKISELIYRQTTLLAMLLQDLLFTKLSKLYKVTACLGTTKSSSRHLCCFPHMLLV